MTAVSKIVAGAAVVAALSGCFGAAVSAQVAHGSASVQALPEETGVVQSSVETAKPFVGAASIKAVDTVTVGNDRIVIFEVSGVDKDGPITYIVCTEKVGSAPAQPTRCSFAAAS